MAFAASLKLSFPKQSLQTSWFVFISRDQTKVKLLYWRGSGLAMWQYRLEKERFQMGRPRSLIKRSISWKDLDRFLDGYNIFSGEPHSEVPAKRVS